MTRRLGEYKRKRDFTATAEPSGTKRSKPSRQPLFVVHKHDASRLHYDLRLENKGVLKSWAVPKGISMDPGDKRLAIQVEDHPYDYKDFEGVIPQGNYGAGNVVIWDEGTYGAGVETADIEKAVAQALDKGHLDVTFYGKKLQGGFSLIKLKDKADHWLLIKKKDAYAGTKGQDERSEIFLEGMDISNAPKRAMPESVKPMLATLVDEPFDKEGWAFEVKWDGYRALARISAGKVRLYSRNNIAQNDKFPAIAEALKGFSVDAIFDGEIVALDQRGLPHFQMLQNYLKGDKGNIVYYVFDILYARDRDVRPLRLSQRRELLKRILPVSGLVRLSDAIETRGRDFYKAAQLNELEGIMAKEMDSQYRSGVRSRSWLKIKVEKRQEAVICGFTQPRASRKYFGALILGVYKGGDLTYIGHSGGGFSDELLRSIHERLKKLATDRCPFKKAPRTNTPATWVKPELLCEIKFKEWTDDGTMRQPVFLGLREDKSPEAVNKEEPVSTKKIVDSKAAQTSPKVKLTNLEKVFWPKEGYTKGDVIKYYDRVSELILPHLKDRPMSLNRFPNGIGQPNFFQKNMQGQAPEWAKTVGIHSDEENKVINYLVCQDKDTLLYAANLASIEMNVWSSRIDRLENPDYVILDFDPVKIVFSRLIEIVLATKELLDELELPAYCKTSGGKGMHIYIPVKRKYTYDQTKDFSYLINSIIAGKMPDVSSLERSPSRRQGMVYLDFLQNRRGATMAAPYSLRPRESATVATPLEWKEVTPRLSPADFTIKTVIKRFEEKGDIWKDILTNRADLSQSLKKLEEMFARNKKQ